MILIPRSSIQLAGKASPQTHFPTGEECCIQLCSLDCLLLLDLQVQQLPFHLIDKIMIYFIGSAVAIQCIIPSGFREQSRVSFSINNGLARIIYQESSSSPQWQHVFWDSGLLEMGPHLLLITNLINGTSIALNMNQRLSHESLSLFQLEKTNII